jgi:nucleoid-associated protein YgaU
MALKSDEQKINAILTAAGAYNPKRFIIPANMLKAEPKKYRVRVYLPSPIVIEKDIVDKSKTYEIQKGDTLEKIAINNYGDPRYWGVLYLINKDKIKNPNEIEIGTEIKIPEKNEISPTGRNVFVTVLQTFEN